MASCCMVLFFGGFVNSLNETETMYESVGESDKRIAENLVGTETMVVLIGGAVVFYGSICYMAFTLTQVQKAWEIDNDV